MRANSAIQTRGPGLQKARTAKTGLSGGYVVTPLLVHNIQTQCAAHFLIWFSSNSVEHIRDVVKRAVNSVGGLAAEVEGWMIECELDTDDNDSNLVTWDASRNGPWVYQKLKPTSITRAVRLHTRGWTAEHFASYGQTVCGKAASTAAIAELDRADDPASPR